MVIACLLHDIGHLLNMKHQKNESNKTKNFRHEEIGAKFLENLGFSEKVCSLVRNHVQAKRYKCSVTPAYYEKLASSSQKTLCFQGGIMVKEEVKRFMQHPNYKEFVKLRVYDDLGKQTGLTCPDFDHFKVKMSRCITRRGIAG
jgi:predicted HD phosphohydrolase